MIPGSANPLLLASAAAAGGYAISRSLRFNAPDSAFLSRTPASAGNRKTWTWAGWVKRGRIYGSYDYIFNANNTANFGFQTNKFFVYDGSLSGANLRLSTAVYRDVSAWYHLVVVFDTSNATAGNRVRVYINGSEVTVWDTNTTVSLNADGAISTATEHYIGAAPGYDFFSGYLADIHFIDGQALDPTSFGEFSATTGVWNPKAYTGSYGTNGFRLDFADNASTTTIGYDAAGSNDWTANNLSVTAGAGNDSLVDVPTNGAETDTGAGGEVRGNYCTLNAIDNGGVTLSDGNLQAADGTNVLVRGTISVSSGKWYYECTPTVVSGAFVIGVATPQASLGYLGGDAYGWGYTGASGGLKYNAGGSAAYGSSIAANDVIGVAIDMDAKTLTFYKNNTSLGTAYSNLTGSVAPAFSGGAGSTCVFNFGARSFAYTAPSGFKALCTANLPAPLVTKPSDVMDVKLITANNSTQVITGLAFSPDLVWTKSRSNAYSHYLYDTVRGVQKPLISNATNAESTIATSLTSFNSDGFTLGADDGANYSSGSSVAWCWDAGSSTVTNTAGTITSQVRANASAGFSIVTYTGDDTSGKTVGHGLGVAPQFFIFKKRGTTSDWTVVHSSLSAPWNNYSLKLNTTDAELGNVGTMDNVAPTSSVFRVSNIGSTGTNDAATYVAYCFAPVVGYSSFGSFVGNGSNDGPMLYLGFRPRWFLYKDTTASNPWVLFDSARSTYNVTSDYLLPNAADAEASFGVIDFLSNGVKIRFTGGSLNVSSNTYIYAAFAESPFAYSRAR
jgi:hypothetical protein